MTTMFIVHSHSTTYPGTLLFLSICFHVYLCGCIGKTVNNFCFSLWVQIGIKDSNLQLAVSAICCTSVYPYIHRHITLVKFLFKVQILPSAMHPLNFFSACICTQCIQKASTHYWPVCDNYSYRLVFHVWENNKSTLL